jgi:hypothetical protein
MFLQLYDSGRLTVRWIRTWILVDDVESPNYEVLCLYIPVGSRVSLLILNPKVFHFSSFKKSSYYFPFIMLFHSLVLSFLSALVFAQSKVNATDADAAVDAAKKPAAPAFSFLYTSFVTLGGAIDYGSGPYGDRLVIPITGGNFSGPGLKGKLFIPQTIAI